MLHWHTVHELPIADLYRWSWGRWRVSESVLQLIQQTLTKHLEVEHTSWRWLKIGYWCNRNQSTVPCRERCDCK